MSKTGEVEMKRLFVPTMGPSDWRRLLADPERHWVKGRSALELAVAWEAARRSARGLPAAVVKLLDSHSTFIGATLLFGIPEHQVALKGGGHASQTDLWALLRGPAGLISMAVEAKAGEAFDKTMDEWLGDVKPTSGKPARLKQLRDVLGLETEAIGALRYQLFHRAASALLEAERFSAPNAILLVQSFKSDPNNFVAFSDFGHVLRCQCAAGAIVEGPMLGRVRLHLAWVECDPANADDLASAV
jgi:hypothetical protein